MAKLNYTYSGGWTSLLLVVCIDLNSFWRNHLFRLIIRFIFLLNSPCSLWTVNFELFIAHNINRAFTNIYQNSICLMRCNKSLRLLPVIYYDKYIELVCKKINLKILVKRKRMIKRGKWLRSRRGWYWIRLLRRFSLWWVLDLMNLIFFWEQKKYRNWGKLHRSIIIIYWIR